MIYDNERPQSRLAYPAQDLVQTVSRNGHAKFHKPSFRISGVSHRHHGAARAVPGQDSFCDLYSAHQRFGRIDLRHARKRDRICYPCPGTWVSPCPRSMHILSCASGETDPA